MSQQAWQETIYVEGAGSAITAAAEALLTSDVPIPAGYMTAGRKLKLTVTGKASNAITTPGTVQFKVRWGGIAGTVLVDSGALTQKASATQTDKTFVLEVYILCLTNGATGTFLTYGWALRGNKENAAASDATPDMLPAASNAAVTVDTTTAKNLSVTVTPSLATASITRLAYMLESLN